MAWLFKKFNAFSNEQENNNDKNNSTLGSLGSLGLPTTKNITYFLRKRLSPSQYKNTEFQASISQCESNIVNNKAMDKAYNNIIMFPAKKKPRHCCVE